MRGAGQVGHRDERCAGGEPVSRRRAIARCRDLGRDQQGDDAPRRGELQRPLQERDREIGTVGVPRAAGAPPPIPAGQASAQVGRQLLGAKPRRVAHHEVEPSGREHIGELNPVVEPGNFARPGERPPERPNLSQLPAQLRQALRVLRVEPPSCAEQVGPAGDVQAFGDG
jgi:hypothetical protein